jgi:hypothetical protein
MKKIISKRRGFVNSFKKGLLSNRKGNPLLLWELGQKGTMEDRGR